jgi:MFS family permease
MTTPTRPDAPLQTPPPPQGRAGGFAVAAMVASLIGIYMVSQFYRNSVGVIGPDLVKEFALSASDLSWLSSAFFLAFAAAQVPLGVAIDRWGPRAAILATAFVALIGGAVFAFAPGYGGLLAGRALLGLGCSSFYMASLSIYAREFAPAKFGSLTGMQLGAGTLGTLLATAPLAYAASQLGWRGAFWIVVAVTAAMTALTFLFVHESQTARAARLARAESWADGLRGVLRATKVRDFWVVFYMQLVTYSPFAAVLGLWGAPWLKQVHGVETDARGRLLFILALAQVAGLFFWGALDRPFRSYKRPALIAVLGAAAILLTAALVDLPAAWLAPFMALFGFVGAGAPLVTSHGKTLFPQELTARGLTLMNIATIGGVWAQATLTGWVMERFASQMTAEGRVYPAEAYHAVFAVMAAELVIGAALYAWRARDLHPLRA